MLGIALNCTSKALFLASSSLHAFRHISSNFCKCNTLNLYCYLFKQQLCFWKNKCFLFAIYSQSKLIHWKSFHCHFSKIIRQQQLTHWAETSNHCKVEKMNSMASKCEKGQIIKIAGLGRLFKLGDQYNYHKDKIVEGTMNFLNYVLVIC